MSTPPQPPPPRPATGGWTGRLTAGLLLLLFGIAWLLEVLDAVEVPWDALLPGGLVLIGIVLLANTRSGASQGGLIAAGVVLTVVLLLGSAIDFPISGGVGERTERPLTISGLEQEYRLGVGQLTIDLSDLQAGRIGSPVRVKARVGIGELVVIVPPALPVRVEGRAALGDVKVFDVEGSGIDVQRDVGPRPNEEALLVLELSVGIGQVEVRRG